MKTGNNDLPSYNDQDNSKMYNPTQSQYKTGPNNYNRAPDTSHTCKGIHEDHSEKVSVAFTNYDSHSSYEGRSLENDETEEEVGNIDLSYDLDNVQVMEKEAENLAARFANNQFSNTPATYDYYEDNYQEVHIY